MNYAKWDEESEMIVCAVEDGLLEHLDSIHDLLMDALLMIDCQLESVSDVERLVALGAQVERTAAFVRMWTAEATVPTD